MAQVVKSPPANAGDLKGAGSISGSGRSPGKGNGNPPQYSCLDNSMDRGTWWATVLGVSKSQTRLSRCWMMEKPSHQFLFFSIFHLFIHFWLPVSSLQHMDFSSCCPWDFSGKGTRVGCHFLRQGIFPTQGPNLGLCIADRFFTV